MLKLAEGEIGTSPPQAVDFSGFGALVPSQELDVRDQLAVRRARENLVSVVGVELVAPALDLSAQGLPVARVECAGRARDLISRIS
ncbi:MAG: hypothetical protein MUC77_21015 [Chromatiaceae bacterium]|nr:hypothetical protein [Chromatiaceae bacterium]